MSTNAPPPYALPAPASHAFEHSLSLPPGLFVLRNKASAKALDVAAERHLPGSPLIAYTPKPPTLIDGSLFHRANNQLFFLDWHGCLCAANSSLRIDVDLDFQLVLSQPSPVSAQPTRHSHPPPQFRYDPPTRTISVSFAYDPTFSGATLEQVNSVDYLLEVQPRSARESSENSVSTLEKLSEWIPFSKPLLDAFDAHPGSSSSTSTASIHQQSSQVSDDDDDSPDPDRLVRVISIAPGWREKFPNPSSDQSKKWLRRQWDISRIVIQSKPIKPIERSNESTVDDDHHHHRSSSESESSIMNPLTDLGEAIGDLGNEISRILRS